MDTATRPGWKTSEAQTSLIALVAAVVSVLAGLPVAVQVAVVAAAGVCVAAYVVTRGRVKAAALTDTPPKGQ